MKLICNGVAREVEGGCTVERLLAELGLEAKHVAVEVNLELVPRGRHAERRLAEGDQLEIVSLVGGG
jgi:sulfur carrier protein